MKFKLLGVPPDARVSIVAVTRFPEGGITNPDTGKTWSRDEYSAMSGDYVTVFHGYRLSEPWEVQPGQWVLEIYHEDRLVGSKSFTLVPE